MTQEKGVEPTPSKGAKPEPKPKIRVKVIYLAARKPFEMDAAAETKLTEVKQAALEAFTLKEGPLPEGGSVSYTLYNGADALTDLDHPVGPLAGPHRKLELKLVQQIVQGALA
jgi:hypothetical protein